MVRLGRVGIMDVGQVFHSDHKLPSFRRQRRLEYATVAAALLEDEGGLAALLKVRPASCLLALYQLPEVIQQRLDYLQGRVPVPIQQAQQPLWQCRLALTGRQLAQLVRRQPTILTLSSERLQERVALLRTVLGMTGEEASGVVGSCSMYLAQDTGGRRQLLSWLVEFYGSQEAARAVVLKCPQLAKLNLEYCQPNVAALRRQLAEDAPQLTEGELAGRVLDIFSRKSQAMCRDLGGRGQAGRVCSRCVDAMVRVPV